jgi:hypothetical protein
MKITLDISDEIAACLFADNWGVKGDRTITQIVHDLANRSAKSYARTFPKALESAMAEFQAASQAGLIPETLTNAGGAQP